MLVEPGERIHVIERRMFESDVRRHFFGVIQHAEGSVVRATGHVFVYDQGSSTYVRGNERRTRIITLGGSGYVVNVAPPETQPEDVRYEERNGRLTVTDGGAFSLDINEFGRLR